VEHQFAATYEHKQTDSILIAGFHSIEAAIIHASHDVTSSMSRVGEPVFNNIDGRLGQWEREQWA